MVNLANCSNHFLTRKTQLWFPEQPSAFAAVTESSLSVSSGWSEPLHPDKILSISWGFTVVLPVNPNLLMMRSRTSSAKWDCMNDRILSAAVLTCRIRFVSMLSDFAVQTNIWLDHSQWSSCRTHHKSCCYCTGFLLDWSCKPAQHSTNTCASNFTRV